MPNSLRHGFTLVELLVVIAILAILSTLGLVNFQTAKTKARDVERKTDLQTIAKSLEAYVNDHRSYPLSDSSGLIICTPPNTTCAWGAPFNDSQGTLYAPELPKDSDVSQSYVYNSNGASYTLYARLGNTQDPAIDNSLVQMCGSVVCNYKISSSNLP